MTTEANKRVTLTVDTSAYAAGDQVGPASTKLLDLTIPIQGVTRLVSVKVIDKSKQKAALDIMFFNSLPTNTTVDNAALDISDTEMVNKFVGLISVATADYKDLANNSVAAVVLPNGMPMRATTNTASPAGKSLWFTVCSRGTPTYTSASDLTFVFEFE